MYTQHVGMGAYEHTCTWTPVFLFLYMHKVLAFLIFILIQPFLHIYKFTCINCGDGCKPGLINIRKCSNTRTHPRAHKHDSFVWLEWNIWVAWGSLFAWCMHEGNTRGNGHARRLHIHVIHAIHSYICKPASVHSCVEAKALDTPLVHIIFSYLSIVHQFGS